jgi:hypothetical protein
MFSSEESSFFCRIHALGRDAMQAITASSVVIIGAKGVGAEIGTVYKCIFCTNIPVSLELLHRHPCMSGRFLNACSGKDFTTNTDLGALDRECHAG